jgi:hypothetical protein
MAQVETSRTIVFAQPRHARGFFDALAADNLDIGRPELVELLVFGHPLQSLILSGDCQNVDEVLDRVRLVRSNAEQIGSLLRSRPGRE